ncbi:MAG: hypothetical protein HQL85_14190 [Magnetococcales bacterium]|nr:hypothetical protein [Magnetococcales bacterium]MBF0174611.1 hypothetical protein [Magnetococcales bacterium]MBF0630640.1 hypothetical protein [Magnetococcales bacterium]
MIGKALGKPTVYYDAVGSIAAAVPVFHGVPVVSGEAALAQWLDREVLPLLRVKSGD